MLALLFPWWFATTDHHIARFTKASDRLTAHSERAQRRRDRRNAKADRLNAAANYHHFESVRALRVADKIKELVG